MLQCIGGGERDLTVSNKDYRLVLTQVLRDVAQCRSHKVLELVRSYGILPLAQFTDARIKPPKMVGDDSKIDVDHYGSKGWRVFLLFFCFVLLLF